MIYLSLFYCFMILFEYDNVVILSLIIFEHVNSHRYNIF
jgi:hypothetical protein